MSPVELVAELAAALRDVIRDTPEESRTEDPEQVYMKMACRLIVRLTPKIVITEASSILPPAARAGRFEQAQAATTELVRILALYRREGCDVETLSIAVIDAYIRLQKAASPGIDTAVACKRLSDEALELARDEKQSGRTH